jgi:hypothetical protein
MNNPIIRDEVDLAETHFPFPKLLQLEFFSQMRTVYRKLRADGLTFGDRNYLMLLCCLNEIHEYDQQHAKSYAKRFSVAGSDNRNNHAIFSEMIVYRYYIRLVHEGLIHKIELDAKEADVIVVKKDGTREYLEVFCVMPDFKDPSEEDEVVVYDTYTHTQDSFSSIRQKLLKKISDQGQMTTPRDNFAVIEINHHLIANDFTVLSSLSDGYKIHFNVEAGKVMCEGYDWRKSVFEDASTRNLKGIIYFFLGSYETRKFIYNPYFKTELKQQQEHT